MARRAYAAVLLVAVAGWASVSAQPAPIHAPSSFSSGASRSWPLCFTASNHTAKSPCAVGECVCDTHRCIANTSLCNGINDCGDNTDEQSCTKASGQEGLGFVGAAIAGLFFGSNLLPVKKYDTGNGLFFQWLSCCGILFVGMIVQLSVGDVQFSRLAFLGGASWATGNLFVVPVIKFIGLAQAILIWGSVNMLVGWASGRFGFFGIIPEKPSNQGLEYGGVALSVVSVLLFALVKTTIKNPPKRNLNSSEERESLLSVNDSSPRKDSESWVDNPGPFARVLGILMACCAGALFGLCFDPSQRQMDTYVGASQNGLHYVFPQFTGMFFTSSVWLLVYCVYTKNQPVANPEIILPGFISGIMWAIAQTSWFIANQRLSQAIAFPIVCVAPGVVATLWGLLVFGEIRGRKNYFALAGAYVCTCAGVALVVMSK